MINSFFFFDSVLCKRRLYITVTNEVTFRSVCWKTWQL